MPPLEVGKKYLVEPKRQYAHMIFNANRIMNNADIKKPPVAKYLGGKTFLFDSDTVGLGVQTEIPNKVYWKFTPVDGGDPVEVDDKNDPHGVEEGGRRTRRRRTIRMKKSEYLREHHHLFKVLKNPTRRALKAELRKQQRELRERGLK